MYSEDEANAIYRLHSNEDFYIIAEVCELFEVNTQKLRQYSEQYDVQPQQDQMGRWGFSKVHVRKLHNAIYKAERGCCKNEIMGREKGPWA